MWRKLAHSSKWFQNSRSPYITWQRKILIIFNFSRAGVLQVRNNPFVVFWLLGKLHESTYESCDHETYFCQILVPSVFQAGNPNEFQSSCMMLGFLPSVLKLAYILLWYYIAVGFCLFCSQMNLHNENYQIKSSWSGELIHHDDCIRTCAKIHHED